MERRLDHFSPSRYTWFEIRVVPAEAATYVLFMRDVTDRVRGTRTEAVREAVREIVMDAPVAITITRGPEHRYEIINNLARQLIGGREVEGQTARNAFPEVSPDLFAVLDEVYRSGQPHAARDVEVTFDRYGDGRLVTATFDVAYRPLFEADGSVAGILNLSVETTDFARARRDREARQGQPVP
jgi:PAS domain-containing protein